MILPLKVLFPGHSIIISINNKKFNIEYLSSWNLQASVFKQKHKNPIFRKSIGQFVPIQSFLKVFTQSKHRWSHRDCGKRVSSRISMTRGQTMFYLSSIESFMINLLIVFAFRQQHMFRLSLIAAAAAVIIIASSFVIF